MKNDRVEHKTEKKYPEVEIPTNGFANDLKLQIEGTVRTGVWPLYLWRGDDDGTVHMGGAQVLYNWQMLIWRARGRVYDKVIQFSPVDVPQELLDHPCRCTHTITKKLHRKEYFAS